MNQNDEKQPCYLVKLIRKFGPLVYFLGAAGLISAGFAMYNPAFGYISLGVIMLFDLYYGLRR